MQTLDADDYTGRYLHYGIREHGMAAAMNGMALHGGVIPYGGAFLVFSDYCHASIRLSALMEQRVIYVMTHDSIGLGEDGPTHQPVEHLASLHAIPNLNVFRPCDAIETAECWLTALRAKCTPSVIVLTRQPVPLVRLNAEPADCSKRGAYVLIDSPKPAASFFATGSEVGIAVAAHQLLLEKGIQTRVVSLPCWKLFAKQDDA